MKLLFESSFLGIVRMAFYGTYFGVQLRDKSLTHFAL